MYCLLQQDETEKAKQSASAGTKKTDDGAGTSHIADIEELLKEVNADDDKSNNSDDSDNNIKFEVKGRICNVKKTNSD